MVQEVASAQRCINVELLRDVTGACLFTRQWAPALFLYEGNTEESKKFLFHRYF